MSGKFKKGQHLFFLMSDGKTQQDSQNKPRYYLNRDRARQYAKGDSEIVEYAPVYNTESGCFMSKDMVNECGLKQLVDELVSLNDENLAQRVIANSDVQWCLSELQDILDADVAPSPQWIKCKDKLPPFVEDVLLFFDSSMAVGYLREKHGSETTWDIIDESGCGIGAHSKPLYWMPLPDAPKDV